MKKYVVVSTNNNPDYYHYLPYIEKAWNTYGWTVACMVTHDTYLSKLRYNNPSTIIIQLPRLEMLRTETIAQGGRLLAANYLSHNDLIMTSDIDMLPLSDYCKPEADKITVHGHDLTDYTYYPMGYTAMMGHKWKEVFGLTGLNDRDFMRLAREEPICFAESWEQWWNFDWKLLTEKLKPYKDEIKFIHRGRRADNPFAFGRIDRGDSMKIIPKPWIDAHCENEDVRLPAKLSKFLSIFEEVYGKL